MEYDRFPFWSLQRQEVLEKLGSSTEGLIAAVAVAVPYSPLVELFSCNAHPPVYLLIFVLIIGFYVFAAELTKRILH
jgi:hypothetical protein